MEMARSTGHAALHKSRLGMAAPPAALAARKTPEWPGRFDDPSAACCARLLRADPPGDLRPMISQRIGSHEQPDMAARHGFLNDAILCSPDIVGGIEDLFRCGDVIVCPRPQIGGTGDVVKI